MLDWREPVWGPKGGGRKGPEKPKGGGEEGPEKPKHKIHSVLSLFHTNEKLLHNFHPINTQRVWVENRTNLHNYFTKVFSSSETLTLIAQRVLVIII